MRWMELMPKAPELSIDAFFAEDHEGHLVMRDRYRDLRCSKCGKIDEYAAIARGLEEDVAMRGAADFCSTSDGVYLVSRRLRFVLDDAGVGGVEYIALPAGGYAVRPMAVVPTDASASGMDFRGRKPCGSCGRYSISLHAPSTAAMQLPTDALVLCSPSLRPELKTHAPTLLLMSEHLAEKLRQANVRDINWGAAARTY